jgi:hypothetical protein
MEDASFVSNLLVSLAPLIVLAVIFAGGIGVVVLFVSRLASSQRRVAEALERIEKALGHK